MGWFIIYSSDSHRICVGYTVYVYSCSIASVSPAKIRSIGLYMGFDGFGMGCSWYNQQKRRYTMIHQTFIVDFNAKSWNVNRIISIYPSKNCNFLGGSKNWDTQIAGWFLHVSTGKSCWNRWYGGTPMTQETSRNVERHQGWAPRAQDKTGEIKAPGRKNPGWPGPYINLWINHWYIDHWYIDILIYWLLIWPLIFVRWFDMAPKIIKNQPDENVDEFESSQQICEHEKRF